MMITTKELEAMGLKDNKLKTAGQRTRMNKTSEKTAIACSCLSVRHTCPYHCKRCYYETVYCQK
jgi:hypothetical protein